MYCLPLTILSVYNMWRVGGAVCLSVRLSPDRLVSVVQLLTVPWLPPALPARDRSPCIGRSLQPKALRLHLVGAWVSVVRGYRDITRCQLWEPGCHNLLQVVLLFPDRPYRGKQGHFFGYPNQAVISKYYRILARYTCG